MEIRPGIRRVGSGIVNVYVLQEGSELTIVDAGARGSWHDLVRELAEMGRSLVDVRAVVLTHAHTDHVGFAERMRRERRVEVSVHEADAALARGEVKPENQQVGRIRPRPLLGFLVWGLRHGLFRTEHVKEVATFGDGATLDVPGSPRAILVPGHTAGSAALHVPSLDTLLVGDAIATYSVLTGVRGPQLAPFGSDPAQAVDSLSRLTGLEASLVLPGHGEPWTSGVDEAVRRVRLHAAGVTPSSSA